MAWSYERFELEDVRLFKTADFDCSRSGNLRTVFGTRLRLFFAIGSGLPYRGERHEPVPDLLTSSAFPRTNCLRRLLKALNKCISLTAPIEEEMPYWLNLEPIPSMLPSWDERGCRILP
jgi:hypothetical protein